MIYRRLYKIGQRYCTKGTKEQALEFTCQVVGIMPGFHISDEVERRSKKGGQVKSSSKKPCMVLA
jgi:hypothetical protein